MGKINPEKINEGKSPHGEAELYGRLLLARQYGNQQPQRKRTGDVEGAGRRIQRETAQKRNAKPPKAPARIPA